MTIALTQIAQTLSDLLIGFTYNHNATLTYDSLETLLGTDKAIPNLVSGHKLLGCDKLATLQSATANDLAFLANPRYLVELQNTHAGAVLVDEKHVTACPAHTLAIIVKNPYVAYARVSELFRYDPVGINTALGSNPNHTAIHATAIIPSTVKLGKNIRIGAYCVLGENITIGDNSRLESHVTLEEHVIIGQHCHIKSHAYIAHHCQLGDFVTLHSHASIGNEGFGFAPRGLPDSAGWQKIHQLGRVIIGNHVRIGSHTCVDRGALDDTLIGDNVIIDNLVQIAHNVEIGAGTAIAGCTGIAGSTKVGKRCVIAGAVGLVGHITLADDVTITAKSLVTKSLPKAGSYSSGTPLMSSQQWRKAAIHFKHAGK